MPPGSSRAKPGVFVFIIISIIPTNAPVPTCPHLSSPNKKEPQHGFMVHSPA